MKNIKKIEGFLSKLFDFKDYNWVEDVIYNVLNLLSHDYFLDDSILFFGGNREESIKSLYLIGANRTVTIFDKSYEYALPKYSEGKNSEENIWKMKILDYSFSLLKKNLKFIE